MKNSSKILVWLLTGLLLVLSSCSDGGGTSTGGTNSASVTLTLDDINITVLPNSSTRIDTGIDQNSQVTIYTRPSHGTVQAFLVANESWNFDYVSSCYTGADSFIYKKDSDEYGRVNIIINGTGVTSEQNRTILTKENIPLLGINLSSISSVSIKTDPSHGNLYAYFDDVNISKFNYYPNRNFSGIDFFDYDVNHTVNGCDLRETARVTINVEPTPALEIPIAFPDSNGDCKVALTDGNSSLTYADDTLYYTACFDGYLKFHKVLNDFEYLIDDNILHSIHQDATISDLNSYQRNTLKTNQIYDWDEAGTMHRPYVFKYQYYQRDFAGNPILHYTENLIYSAYTPVTNENSNIEAPIFGTLPWSDTYNDAALFDIVGDVVAGDQVITSYAGIDNDIYFVGYDGVNGNGISLACTELRNGTPAYDGKCQGIQLYLNAFDVDAHDTSLLFSNSYIVSVLNKSLVFTYTHGINQPHTKLFISDGEVDYFDSNEINKHVKLISDDQYYKLDLQKPETSYTLFYKGQNITTDKTEIGYIKETFSALKNRYYLNPDQANLLTACEDNSQNNDNCSDGLIDSTFTLEKLYEYQDVDSSNNLRSKWLAVDDSHIYLSERNTSSNGDILKVIDKKNNTVTYINIALLNISTARVFDIKLIGNYVYLVIGKSTKDFPISLWKIDPTDNSAVQIEGYQADKYIKVFDNSLNHGNSMVYSVMTINDAQDVLTDFTLYRYDASTDSKKLLSTQDHLNYP